MSGQAGNNYRRTTVAGSPGGVQSPHHVGSGPQGSTPHNKNAVTAKVTLE